MTPKQRARFWAQIQWGSQLKFRGYHNSVRSPIQWLCPQPQLKVESPVDKKAASQLSSKFSLSYTQPNTSLSKGFTMLPITQAGCLASSLISPRPYFPNQPGPWGHLLPCHSHPSLPLWSYCHHHHPDIYTLREKNEPINNIIKERCIKGCHKNVNRMTTDDGNIN